MKQVIIQVIENATGKVLRTHGPMDDREAERVQWGIEINLDRSLYATLLKDAPDAR
jgi:hypothetical protein